VRGFTWCFGGRWSIMASRQTAALTGAGTPAPVALCRTDVATHDRAGAPGALAGTPLRHPCVVTSAKRPLAPMSKGPTAAMNGSAERRIFRSPIGAGTSVFVGNRG
jgi:hypothetical protein